MKNNFAFKVRLGHFYRAIQWCVGFVFCFLFVSAHAQDRPVLLPVERFFQNPKVLQAKLSPTGRHLALTTSAGMSRAALVVVHLTGPLKIEKVAHFSDVDVSRFEWSSEDRLVFNVIDLASGSGEDRYEAPGLYSVKLDGSELRQLVKRQAELVVSAPSLGHSALDWYHTLLHVPLAQDGVVPDDVVIGRMNFGVDGLQSIHPMWLNARTGRTRSMPLLDIPKGAVSWMFDSKGVARLAQTHQDGMLGLYWHGQEQTAWVQLAQAPIAKGLPFEPVALDASGQLYVTQKVGAQGESALTRFDFNTLAPQNRMLVQAPGFDFRGSLVLDDLGTRALGVHIETDGEQTLWFDAAMKQMQALADERFPGQINRISCRRCGAPDMVVLVQSHSDRNPGQLWLYQADGRRWQLISHILDGIDPQQMATVEFQRIKARDGRDLPVWLTLPKGVKPGKPAPAVVMVHGGPWVRGGHWRWMAWEQFLASRGYVVISPEFRGSRGYGSVHFQAGMKQWGQSMQDDVADALLWARSQGLVNERACIAGASYGGYSTLMGLVRHPELYRCGVAWVAVSDLMLLVKGSWWITDDIINSSRRFHMTEWVGDPEKEVAMLKANSPLAQAQRIKSPLLLGMGEADVRVPLAHGTRIRDALTEAGNPPQWVSYPNEGHSWRLVSTRVDFARRMEAFLRQNLEVGQ